MKDIREAISLLSSLFRLISKHLFVRKVRFGYSFLTERKKNVSEKVCVLFPSRFLFLTLIPVF